ncbi:MAG: methyltransferase domain-containing protein [Chitinophagia bacterium]
MDIAQAYNSWSAQYDTNENKTRDLEALSLKKIVQGKNFKHCLEVGCGTGKNTEWLLTICDQITAIDLSAGMLEIAKNKIRSDKVNFIEADITKDWTFAKGTYDLVTFSLMLEHIEDLDAVFQKLAKVSQAGTNVYIGELHPFKQYAGSKARFETESGTHVVTCFNHHVTDFIQAANASGFQLLQLEEQFDDADRSQIPRILNLLFEKL